MNFKFNTWDIGEKIKKAIYQSINDTKRNWSKANLQKLWHHLPYGLWLLFYYLLFSFGFGLFIEVGATLQIFALIYGVSIVIADTTGEFFFHRKLGLRRVETRKEKELLLPIFKSVYENAKVVDPLLSDNIELYIYDSMEINAFAFGKRTMVVTKGCMQLLNQTALYGVIAHEFGHFSAHDTEALLLANIGNSSLSIVVGVCDGILQFMRKLTGNRDRLAVIGLLQAIITLIYKTFILLGAWILSPCSRKSEFRADKFALDCGYGDELCYALSQFEMMETTPLSYKERVLNTHPTTTSRIAKMESLLYIDEDD